MKRLHSPSVKLGLGLLFACSAASAAQTPRSPVDVPAISAKDPNARCVADRARSKAVPFRVVPIEGTLMERTARLLMYTDDVAPRTRTVVRDSSEWLATWRMVADTVPPPEVHFGDDGLILVATQGRLRGPNRIAITSVRRCRSTGALVVTSVEQLPLRGGTDAPDRGMSKVRVARHELVHGKVLFRDLYVRR